MYEVDYGGDQTLDYTSSNVTVPIAFNGTTSRSSAQGQLTLNFPPVLPPATLDAQGYVHFQTPLQGSMSVSGTFTTSVDNFSSSVVLGSDDSGCAAVDKESPVPPATFSASSPCSWSSTPGLVNPPTGSWPLTVVYHGHITLNDLTDSGNWTSFLFYVTTTYKVSGAPAPSTADLAVDHVEVVQVVQHPDNSIPLIANKSTAVRVFAAVTGNSSQPLAGVTGALHVFRNGVELPDSPIFPNNNPFTVPVHYDRNSASDSLNFFLPRSWTAAGSIKLVADFIPPQGVTGHPYTVPQPITFTALSNIPNPINIYYWPICYQPPGAAEKACPSDDLSGADSLIPKLFPIPDDGVRYVPLQTRQRTWTRPLIQPEDAVPFFAMMRKAYLLLEAHHSNVDQLAAWVPYISGAKDGGDSDPIWLGGTSRVLFVMDNQTEEYDAVGLAHELGHNLGLRHTATGKGCDTSQDPQSDWNVPPGTRPDPTIQEVGMDPVTMEVKPATKMDLMSYCDDPPSNIWISDFHYGQLIDSLDLGLAGLSGANARLASRQQTRPAAARPHDTTAEYVLISGSVRADGTAASLDPAYQISALTPGESSDPTGDHCLRFTDSGGASSDFCFALSFQDPETFAPLDNQSFAFRVALPAGTTRIALRYQGLELAALNVSSQAPSLQILTPSAGDKWDGSSTISWSASGPNGSPLSYMVEYSGDGGNSWTPLEVDLQDTQLTFDSSEIQAGANTFFRVLATSGVTTASALAGPVEVAATPRLGAPPSLAFGVVAPGQSADQTLWVRNKGNGPLTVQSLSIDNPVFSVVSPAALFVIPVGGRQQVAVRFTPPAAGPQTGTITITSDDPLSPVTRIALSGGQNSVSATARIAMSPNSLNFGSVITGQSKDMTLTVENTGTATLTVSRLSIASGTFRVVSPAAPFDVTAGGQQTVTVRFSPAAAGAQNGGLNAGSNDATAPSVSVPLTGQGASTQAPPAAAVLFSDSFNRAAEDGCSLGKADLSLGGSGSYYYLPVFSGAQISGGTLQNIGTGSGGVQLTDSASACNDGSRGVSIGQDFNVRVDLLVPSDSAGDLTEAGPYFRNRAAAAGDGILGGDSAGYWIELASSGEVKVKNVQSETVTATTVKPARFDSTVFHTLEAAVQGSAMQVALDGQLLAFTQGSGSDTTVAIPDTGGSNDGTAGIAFGRENGWPAIGGQAARNLVVTAYRSLATPPSPVHVAAGGVRNAGNNQPVVAGNSWISIYGDHLSATTRIWHSADFNGNLLPVSLDGVSVQISGENAPVSFISPGQINALVPADIAPGTVDVTVTNLLGTSAYASVALQTFSPAFFQYGAGSGHYVAAVNSDGALLGPAGLLGSSVQTRPAKPGDTVLLYGTGFGPTTPAIPTDEIPPGAAPLVDPSQVTITIGGVKAAVLYAGLVGPGLYQFNVVVPAVGDGDQLVMASIGGSATQAGALITVQH